MCVCGGGGGGEGGTNVICKILKSCQLSVVVFVSCEINAF